MSTATGAASAAEQFMDELELELQAQLAADTMESLFGENVTNYKEGEVVRGRVVEVGSDRVLVDIGYKSEGVIPANELSIRRNVNPRDEVDFGEEVDALVLRDAQEARPDGCADVAGLTRHRRPSLRHRDA